MEHQRKLFQQRGYSEDLLPKTQSQRTWKTFNYFTLWMGSVHNVPNYVMVGGFFILGLSTFREGANKQVISSQADSLIKISRIWADFFPANTSNQPI